MMCLYELMWRFCNYLVFELTKMDRYSSCPCQTPSAASESTSEPEAITAPVPLEPPPPTTSLNSYYNTAPCLPPYTAYDVQVQTHFNSAALHVEHRVGICSTQLLIGGWQLIYQWHVVQMKDLIEKEIVREITRQYYKKKFVINSM